jgi:hypothetical protein
MTVWQARRLGSSCGGGEGEGGTGEGGRGRLWGEGWLARSSWGRARGQVCGAAASDVRPAACHLAASKPAPQPPERPRRTSLHASRSSPSSPTGTTRGQAQQGRSLRGTRQPVSGPPSHPPTPTPTHAHLPPDVQPVFGHVQVEGAHLGVHEHKPRLEHPAREVEEARAGGRARAPARRRQVLGTAALGAGRQGCVVRLQRSLQPESPGRASTRPRRQPQAAAPTARSPHGPQPPSHRVGRPRQQPRRPPTCRTGSCRTPAAPPPALPPGARACSGPCWAAARRAQRAGRAGSLGGCPA